MYSVGLLDKSYNSKYLFMRIYLYHLTGINYWALLSLVWKRQMEYNIEHFLIFIKVIVKYHVIKSNMQLSWIVANINTQPKYLCIYLLIIYVS